LIDHHFISLSHEDNNNHLQDLILFNPVDDHLIFLFFSLPFPFVPLSPLSQPLVYQRSLLFVGSLFISPVPFAKSANKRQTKQRIKRKEVKKALRNAPIILSFFLFPWSSRYQIA